MPDASSRVDPPSLLPAMLLSGGLLSLFARSARAPNTAYAHAERVKKAKDALEAACVAADRAYMETSTASVLGVSSGRQLLLRDAHREAQGSVEEARADLEAARHAEARWLAQVELLPSVLDAVEGLLVEPLTQADVKRVGEVLETDGALLRGLLVFSGVPYAAQRVVAEMLEGKDKPEPNNELRSVCLALKTTLDAARAWLGNPVNVDPTVAPPERSGGGQAVGSAGPVE